MKNWSNAQYEKYIRRAVADLERVVFTEHALKQMRTRRITNATVIEVLTKGRMVRVPEPNLRFGTIECRIERYCVGRNTAIMVAISEDDPRLLIITAMYL